MNIFSVNPDVPSGPASQDRNMSQSTHFRLDFERKEGEID